MWWPTSQAVTTGAAYPKSHTGSMIAAMRSSTLCTMYLYEPPDVCHPTNRPSPAVAVRHA